MRKITERKIMYSELEKLENYLLGKIAYYQAKKDNPQNLPYTEQQIADFDVRQKVYMVALNTILDSLK